MNILFLSFVPIILFANSFCFNFGEITDKSTNYNIFEVINNNISIFNEESEDGTKPKTNYKTVTNFYTVYSPFDSSKIGVLLIFDVDKGYLSIDNNYHILDSNYYSGISLVGEKKHVDSIYYFNHEYSFERDKLLEKVTLKAGSVVDYFHWHSDSSWTSEKQRNLLLEHDSYYATLVDTTQATYYGNTTWSTYQAASGPCGSIAVANLLWTYKINNSVDLTGGVSSSYYLSTAISMFVPDNACFYELNDINDSLLSGTGYSLDYISNTSAISTFLTHAPVIALYNASSNDGHYALVTGEGESLYKTILWINLYTTWDIVNTWYDRYSYNSGYLSCKYWVDRQYATWCFYLKTNGYIVDI